MKPQSDNYKWAFQYFPKSIKNVVEVGSRDALDAIAISEHFNCDVVSFEPNPKAFELCVENVSLSGTSRIIVRKEALTDYNRELIFHPVDPTLYDNIGASSLFEIDFTNRMDIDPDKNRTSIQSSIKVQGARWDSLGMKDPDILFLDVEGAELLVLRGFGEHLTNVKGVVCEAAPVPSNIGGCTLYELHRYLRSQGFRYRAGDLTGRGRGRLLIWLLVRLIQDRRTNLFGKPRFRGQINLCYVRKMKDS